MTRDLIKDRLLIWIRHPLAQSLALFVSSTGLAQAMMVVYAVLLARQLAPENYGVFIACYSAAAVTAFLFNWGLDSWLIKEAAAHPQPLQLTGTVLQIKASLGLFWALAILSIFPAVRPGLFPPVLLALSTLDIWFDSCNNSQIATLNATRSVPSVSRLILISRGSRLLGAVILILWQVHTPLPFAAIRLAATVITFLISTRINFPQFPRWSWPRVRSLFKQALPFSVSDLLTMIYVQGDVTLLSLITGSKKAVGDYSPALSIVNALFVIPTAFYSTLLPVLVRLYQSRSKQFYTFLAVMYSLFGGVGLLLWLIFRFGGNYFAVLLLGKNYAASGALVVILSPILLLKCVSIANSTFLVAVDQQKKRILPQAVSAAANVLLNLWFIPIYLAFGAANVYVASEILLLVGYSWFTIHWLQQNRTFLQKETPL